MKKQLFKDTKKEADIITTLKKAPIDNSENKCECGCGCKDIENDDKKCCCRATESSEESPCCFSGSEPRKIDYILYDTKDGLIEKINKDEAYKKYSGVSQPKLTEELVIYFAGCSDEDAKSLCKDEDVVFELTPFNGTFNCDVSGKKFSKYVGVCLPEEELYLWALVNKKKLYARPNGNAYTIGQDCNRKTYAKLELLRTYPGIRAKKD